MIARPRCLGAFAGLLLTLLWSAGLSAQELRYVASPVSVGQKYYMAPDALTSFIGRDPSTGEPGPLTALAREAELEGHERVVALRPTGIDVFAVSPRTDMTPEDFSLLDDLAIDAGSAARILVEVPWSAGGTDDPAAEGGGSQRNLPVSGYGRVDEATVQGWIDRLHAPDGYLWQVRTQLARINERAGRPMAFLVPSVDAVHRLRLEVLRGEVPGIERESQLFVDGGAEAGTPVRHLLAYVWFTSIYRQPATGLTALVEPGDATSAERERLLQLLAWDVVTAEPMGGLMVEHLWLGRSRGVHPHPMPHEGHDMPDMPPDHMDHR